MLSVRHLSVFVVSVALIAVSACKKDEPKGEVHAYTVRGRIEAIRGDGSEVTIYHEAIPDFVDIRGETAGMMSMSMPFRVGEDVDLSGLTPGDEVSFTFDVDWSRSEGPSLIQAIEELPADAALELSDGSSAEESGASDDPADDAPGDPGDHAGH